MNKVIIFVFFAHKKYSRSLLSRGLFYTFYTLISHGFFNDVLTTFLDLIVLGSLLSMEGQRALGIHQKYLNLCSEDERRSYGFGTT